MKLNIRSSHLCWQWKLWIKRCVSVFNLISVSQVFKFWCHLHCWRCRDSSCCCRPSWPSQPWWGGGGNTPCTLEDTELWGAAQHTTHTLDSGRKHTRKNLWVFNVFVFFCNTEDLFWTPGVKETSSHLSNMPPSVTPDYKHDQSWRCRLFSSSINQLILFFLLCNHLVLSPY